MNDKMKRGWAVGRATRMSLVLAFLFLLASGANAKIIDVYPGPGTPISDNITLADIWDTVQVHPGIYDEQILVNQAVILRGLDNPTLTNASPGSEVINVTGLGATSVITGFNITGNPTAVHINGSDEAYNVSLVYNNIYRNAVGLNSEGFSLCRDFMPYTLNFWGENGTGRFKGKDSAATTIFGQSNVEVNNKASSKVASKVKGKTNSKVNGKTETKANIKVGSIVHRNNGIIGLADNTSWLTAGVVNGNVIAAYMYEDCPEQLVLLNPDARVDVSIYPLSTGSSCIIGSAAYIGTPYGPIPPGLGVAIRYVDVFVKHDNVDQVKVNISYTPEEVVDAGVFEDSLTPYLWTGVTWISPISGTLIRDPDNGVVSGNFTAQSLSGQPIALIGRSYKVTIIPRADPTRPISINPVLNITLESGDNITGVYYQLDSFASSGWKQIEVPFDGQIWNNSTWSMPDSDWANLTNASHTFYFRITRATTSDVGGNGEISWRFTKGGNVPPVSPIVITSPKEGDTLTRTPWLITWTMPHPENVNEVDLYFARDGNFYENGGLSNPITIAKLGGDTSYLWRSPNFQTDTAKIAAVVMYNDGTQYVGISDNFSLAKGYSFHAYKPVHKTPWQLGSGVSRAVAVLGSWFKKPHIPYVIG